MPPPTQSAPHLGPLFDMWFTRACNRDPAQRFTTAKELVDQLAQSLGVNQTGAGLTTGTGGQFDSSSLQIHAQFGQTGPGASQPGMDSTSPPAIPGTAVPTGEYPELGSTNAPLYSTQQPFGRKRSSSLAVALGVVIAVVVAIGGVGVYLVMPQDTAAAPSAEPSAAPAATVGATEDAPEEPDEPTGDEDGEEDTGETTASADSATAKPTATAAPAKTTPRPTAANTQPTTTKPPKPPPKATTTPTKKPPKVAPKVDKVTF